VVVSAEPSIGARGVLNSLVVEASIRCIRRCAALVVRWGGGRAGGRVRGPGTLH
jgi:hypothetical protein